MITDPSGIFTESIKAPNTSIIPLVLFVRQGSLKKTISTNSINIIIEGFGDITYFEPLLLNIPSIRESVDFENRNFKIGNISLSISNSAHKNNDRFSDSLPDIINSTCVIYWKVPRAKTLGDCLSVYTGKVKRMTHDDTKVTLQIEDQTQENLHKDLPIEFVSTDLEILDKYKNKPIPFVYGQNKKHKSIIRPKNDGTDDLEVVSDTFDDLEGFYYIDFLNGTYDLPLKVQNSNKEFAIRQTTEFGAEYGNGSQYSVDDNNIITLKRIFLTTDENLEEAGNSIADNRAYCHYINRPDISIDNITNQNRFYRYFVNGNQSGTTMNQVRNNHFSLIDKSNLFDNNLYNSTKIDSVTDDLVTITKQGGFGPNNDLFRTSYIHLKLKYDLLHLEDFDMGSDANLHFAFSLKNITSSINGRIRLLILRKQETIEEGATLGWQDDVQIENPIIQDDHLWDFVTNSSSVQTLFYNKRNDSLNLYIIPEDIIESDNTEHNVTMDVQLNSFDIQNYGYINNLFDKDIYTTIRGRKGLQDQDYIFNTIRKTIIGNFELVYENNELYLLKKRIDLPSLANLNEVSYNNDNIYEVSTEDGEILFTSQIEEWDRLWSNDFDYMRIVLTNQEFNQSLDNVIFKQLHPYIECPSDIMRHLLINDIGFNGAIQQDELEIARNEHNGFYFSISQTKKINSKKLFENIAKQSKFFPKFRNDGSFGFNTIKDIYTKDDAELIEIRDIINYKFDRTKIDDLKTKVKVIYGKDNITDEYLKSTPYLEASNYFEGYENSYYGLEDDHRTSTLDFEAEYVQHEQTALLLRNFLMAWYANQHNIVSVDLPLKYMKYEIGDVVQFDSLINNLKLYGEDYTEIVSRNGQDIYPYFMIMETNKSIDKISFKLVQLHKNIVPEEQPQDDEINRSIKPPKGGFIAEQVENALNKNPSLANIQELTNER
tara:strand:- start:1297 stop:4113 length:2817 start_codon:yes stop_codon:yes gene_type:complete